MRGRSFKGFKLVSRYKSTTSWRNKLAFRLKAHQDKTRGAIKSRHLTDGTRKLYFIHFIYRSDGCRVALRLELPYKSQTSHTEWLGIKCSRQYYNTVTMRTRLDVNSQSTISSRVLIESSSRLDILKVSCLNPAESLLLPKEYLFLVNT